MGTCIETSPPTFDPFQQYAEADGRLQPWRLFWPQDEDRDQTLWSQSEFPEVSSWKFDPECPFERPWRTWTRTSRARAEATQNSPSEPSSPTSVTGNTFGGREMHNYTSSGGSEADLASQEASAKDLDAQISYFDLQPVAPRKFYYLSPLDTYRSEKPYLSRLPCIPGFARTNIRGSSRPVSVHEVSGNEHLFSLDSSGFEFVEWEERFQNWTDAGACEEYIPKLAQWLKGHLDCSEVYIYAYNFRSNGPAKEGEKPWKTPFFRAHCDATTESCMRRLELYLPGKAAAKSTERIRFINIWRAITTPLQNCPLALCDDRTVTDSDLVPADIIFPHYLDQAYELLHNPRHRWFYKQGLTETDMILFKLADSAENVAPRCAHSAFLDPSVPLDTPERTSIEVRAIVIG